MNNQKLYVGNLPYSTTEEALAELFSQAGTVEESIIIKDKFSQRSKGFGFITMASEEDAQKAIEMFNEYEFEGRNLIVNVARPKAE